MRPIDETKTNQNFLRAARLNDAVGQALPKRRAAAGVNAKRLTEPCKSACRSSVFNDFPIFTSQNSTTILNPAKQNTVSDLRQTRYYPFGLTHQGYNNITTSLGSAGAKKYQYNGKELQDDYGLDLYDYGARFYDPALGRWFVVDGKAEKYYAVSPYTYALNNPILFLDPDGHDVKVSTAKNKKTGRTTVTFNVTMSVVNKSYLSNSIVLERANDVKSQIEHSFAGYDSKTNTEYKTVVHFDKNEQDYSLVFTDDIKGASIFTTGKVDKIGDTKDNKMQVRLEEKPEGQPLQSSDETSQTGVHEYGHTLGLRHPSEYPEPQDPEGPKRLENNNLMISNGHGTHVNIIQLEQAKEQVEKDQKKEQK